MKEQDQQQFQNTFHKEIKSELKNIFQFPLYKIYGEEQFSFEKAHYESKVDWSGFYTQFTPEHSMRYLTKKWSDGAEMACLIKLFATDFNLKILYVEHKALGDFKISGDVKAYNIKQHLKGTYEQFQDIQHHKLLEYLGTRQILMSCIDCQDQQIIIPHQLLNHNHFRFQHLASFKRSNDGMLRTINFKKGQHWKKVPAEVQFQPYLLLNQIVWNEQEG